MKKINKQAIGCQEITTEENEMTFGDFVKMTIFLLFCMYLVTLGFLSHSTYDAMSEMQKAIKLNSDKIEKLYLHSNVVYIPEHTKTVESEAITYQTMTDRFWSGELDYELLRD